MKSNLEDLYRRGQKLARKVRTNTNEGLRLVEEALTLSKKARPTPVASNDP